MLTFQILCIRNVLITSEENTIWQWSRWPNFEEPGQQNDNGHALFINYINRVFMNTLGTWKWCCVKTDPLCKTMMSLKSSPSFYSEKLIWNLNRPLVLWVFFLINFFSKYSISFWTWSIIYLLLGKYFVGVVVDVARNVGIVFNSYYSFQIQYEWSWMDITWFMELEKGW